MDTALENILEVALQQGIWAALYIYLFFRMLRENAQREEKYQQMIDTLSQNIQTGIDNIQNRLDEVVGPQNWYNEYKPWHGTGKREAQICGISKDYLDSLCEGLGDYLLLEVDHIQSVSQGGTGDDIDNLQCLCWRCNRKKGGRRTNEQVRNMIDYGMDYLYRNRNY